MTLRAAHRRTPRERVAWTSCAVALAIGAAGAIGLGASTSSCSLGEGQGAISGTLNVPLCWSGRFTLNPDFFAAVPYRNSVQLRIQSGGDYQTFSDGLSILVDDVATTRGQYLGRPLEVALSPEVTPPGVPIQAIANPALVHMTLYLQRTCHTQNVALYVVDQVTLNPDGSCDAPEAGDVPSSCGEVGVATPADAGADAAPADASTAPPSPIGKSTITFFKLFNGDPDEANAAERLTEASFDVYLADPREVCPGGLGPPPRCRGHLVTNPRFKFYFERGRPGQPFP